MYRVQKVSPNNINALFEIAADNAFRVKEIEEQVFRNEGVYYILEDGEKILASAYWIQDPEREHWIRLKSVKVDIQKGGNLAEILEALIEASEHSFCITYQNSFRSEGRQTGIKISLFDVSDVENPKEIAKFVSKEDYAQTTAEYEHKAFLFSKEKNLVQN